MHWPFPAKLENVEKLPCGNGKTPQFRNIFPQFRNIFPQFRKLRKIVKLPENLEVSIFYHNSAAKVNIAKRTVKTSLWLLKIQVTY
jgi:hypothetical protein